MTWTTLMFAILAFDGTAATFAETETYRPFRARDVAVAADGSVFLSNFEEGLILGYSADGSEKVVFGGKGQGPGELNFVTQLAVEGGKLYAVDAGANNISVFDAETTAFIERMSMPAQGIEIMKVNGGWLYGNWQFSMDPDAPVELTFVDNNLENPVKIAAWPREGGGSGFMIQSNGGVPEVPFNPARDGYRMIASLDGTFAYLSHPGDLKISVVDVANQKIVNTMTPEATVIPFSEEWGQARLKEITENSKRGGGMELKFKADFPENFPFVQSLYVGPDNSLVLRRFAAAPEERLPYMVLDRTGKEVDLPYRPQNQPRVMAIHDGHAYVGTYDADVDEAGLIRVPLADVDQVVTDHPIAYEGDGARLVVRMN